MPVPAHSRRSTVFGAIALAAALVVTSWANDSQAEEPLVPTPSYDNLIAPLVESYCSDCHAGGAAEGGLAFEKIDGGEDFQKHRGAWQEIARRLRDGTMPPPDSDRPSDDEQTAWLNWIAAKLQEFDCSQINDPGWVTLRRLNRDQYRNTIRDLLGVKYEPGEHFPPDELGYGFDNNGDVLMLSPTLIEKYLAAASQIAAEAIVAPESLEDPSRRVVRRKWQGGIEEPEGVRALYTNGVVEFEHDFEKPGLYMLRATVSGEQAGDEPVKVGLRDGDQIAKMVELWEDQVWEPIFLEIEATQGKRKLGVEFLNDFYVENGPGSNPVDRNFRIRKLEIVGPLDNALRGRPTAQRRWFARRPSVDDWRDDQAWRPLAKESIERLLRHAYRRPATEEDVERLVELADSARRAGESYERAMQLVLEGVLVSPKFLFIGNLEPEPRPDVHPVDEYELASRLSYFLWSAPPDEQLLGRADKGELRQHLRAEVDRMLRDKRIEQFARNFTGQWLGTRLLADTKPDKDKFPEFDDELREAMAREAELVVAEVLRSDAPIVSLIDAPYTYLNERLARHYGIPGVEGNHFRKVELNDLPPEAGIRGGVLTMGGVLTTTSFPTRTAPVLRGKWILGELLGREPPPPPPDVPPLNERRSRRSAASLREQLERHREDPTCASCHVEMDGLGFALESFDAVGRWRSEERGQKIDTTGELPGGRKIEGVRGLQQALLEHRDQFRRCLTEKMLTYALARGLEYQDECTVRAITDHLAENGDRMQELLHAIVASDPFQKRRGTIPPKEDQP